MHITGFDDSMQYSQPKTIFTFTFHSESNTAENLVYEFNDFYFRTEPEQLAHTYQLSYSG